MSVTLKECFSPPKGLEIVESLLLLKYHLTSLISFHTFACTPPEVRKGFMCEVRNRSALTQAAITRSERYLTIQKINKGMTVDKLSRMSSTGDNRAGEGFRKTSEDIWKEASRKVGNNTQREMAAERSKSEHTDKRTYSGFGRFDECSREKVRTLESKMRDALLLSKNALVSNSKLLQRSQLQ